MLLPSALRLEGSLKRSKRSPFDQDFLISARLNHLHVLFLLHLLCLRSPTDPSEDFFLVSREILSLVVEVVVLRGQIVNSGTSTVWKVRQTLCFHVTQVIPELTISTKVAHYGLPAVGIILLAMVRQTGPDAKYKIPRNRVLQDLGVLVAEIEMGTIIRPGEPNFTLLSAAAETIQRFLDRLQVEELRSDDRRKDDMSPPAGVDTWDIGLNLEPWNFEVGFWESLAEHPSLFHGYAE